jgi:hypothetical protein
MITAILLAASLGQFIGPEGGTDALPFGAPTTFSAGFTAPGAYPTTGNFLADTGQVITCSRASSATYLGGDGLLHTAASNQCRVEPRGLLVEGPSTNVALQSEAFDNAAWSTAGSAVVTANQVAAPDGNVTADKIADASSTAAFGVFQTISFSAATYTFSVYLKAGSLSCAIVQPVNGAVRAKFNLSNGTVGYSDGSAAPTIQAIGSSGWYRVTTTLAMGAGNQFPEILLASVCNDSSVSYVGTGSGYIYAWGADVEQLSSASSYLATAGTSTARVQDVVSISNPVSSGSDWCVAATVDSSELGAWFTSSNLFWSIGAASSANSAYTNGGFFGIYDSTGTQKFITLSAPSSGAHRVISRATNGGVMTASVDGTVITSTSGTGTGVISAQPGTVFIGSGGSGSFPLYGWLQNFQIDKSTGGCR